MAQLLVVFTLICAIGGHWAILQSVAWVGMVVSYSQNSTLQEALVKTFDGKHPCRVCKVVAKEKQAEQKQVLLKVETKLDFCLVHASAWLHAPPPFDVFPSESDSGKARFESPPRRHLGWPNPSFVLAQSVCS
jgi:hypothetical protein